MSPKIRQVLRGCARVISTCVTSTWGTDTRHAALNQHLHGSRRPSQWMTTVFSVRPCSCSSLECRSTKRLFELATGKRPKQRSTRRWKTCDDSWCHLRSRFQIRRSTPDNIVPCWSSERRSSCTQRGVPGAWNRRTLSGPRKRPYPERLTSCTDPRSYRGRTCSR